MLVHEERRVMSQPSQPENKPTRLMVGQVMNLLGLSTQKISDDFSLAYNTVLSHRRGNSELVSLRVLDRLGQAMGMQAWQLLYQGQWARPLIKIADALGVDPIVFKAGFPVTDAEYRELFKAIGAAAGADIRDSDFEPVELPESE